MHAITLHIIDLNFKIDLSGEIVKDESFTLVLVFKSSNRF